MQTLSRLSVARNRPSYTHDVTNTHLANHNPYWDAMNRAEYYVWSALRFRTAFGSVKEAAEHEAYKAKARYFLRLAAQYRDHKIYPRDFRKSTLWAD